MAIYNLGSINADHFYQLPHLPRPGETLAASAHQIGLGGKGANQSIAAARAGACVHHIGAVGGDGQWAIDKLAESGVGTDHIATLDGPTAHAIINVDGSGENAIVIYSAANVRQDSDRISAALSGAQQGDFCLLQNETNLVVETAEMARANGLRVVYSAAPFESKAVAAVLRHVDMLVLNEVEAQQLSKAMATTPEKLPVRAVLITKGAQGAVYRDADAVIQIKAFQVTPLDTTGAGDTFLGFFIAALDSGQRAADALQFAAAGSAIQVTRRGTSDAIPDRAEILDFLGERVGERDDSISRYT